MKMIFFAVAALAAFVAIWVFVVIPAERRQHERKLENVRKRIELREAAGQSRDGATDVDSPGAG
jgi:predicted MFS family arabinose efflux permease